MNYATEFKSIRRGLGRKNGRRGHLAACYRLVDKYG